MKKKLTIFVACHKPSNVVSDDVYKPIHVGRTGSAYKNELKNLIGDDTGDNISKKNPYYSEMTGLYWVWKNYSDSEYVGFCHYRRFFSKKITDENVETYFKKSDVLMVDPSLKIHNRLNFLKNYVCGEDVFIVAKVLKKLYPDYFKTFCKYSNDFLDYPFNMFVCRKDVFDKYAEWIFSVLFECEKYIKYSPYSRGRRVFAYLAEYLTPVFFLHNNFRIKTLPVYNTEYNTTDKFSFSRWIAVFLLRIVYSFRSKNDFYFFNDIRLGLKNDGIVFDE